MTSSSLARARFAQGFGIMILTGCLSGLLPSFGAFAQQTIPSAIQLAAAPTSTTQATEPLPPQSREAWRAEMSRRPVPKNGCFTAKYPSTEWQEVPCGRPSPYHNPGRSGARPNQVGHGTDFVAKTSGRISTAVGSFESVNGLCSESGDVAGTSFVTNNIFTLQLNSQANFLSDGSTFSTAACNGHSGCSGWQQFVFSQTQGPPPGPGQQSAAPSAPVSTTPGLFIEYWLINYGASCPTLPSWAGRGTWRSDGKGSCWFNGPTTYVPPLTAADFAPAPSGLVMTATAGASQDKLVLATTSGMYVYQEPSVLGLSQVWTEAEFNIFGDCCLTQAVFNRGTTIVVKTSIDDGTTNPPACVPNDGTTGETNNLTLVSPCTASGGASPAIVFTESIGGPPAISGPFVDTYAEHDQQHFAYLAANGDIWDAFYCPGCSGDKWQFQKINDGGMTPNGPPAITAPFVNDYSGHDQQHFAYLATNENGRNGEIWDAFYCPGCSGDKWRLQKINSGGAAPNAPPAASAPFVNVYSGHNQQHFAYLATNENGRNGEIWDAFYCPDCSGNKWQSQQINCGKNSSCVNKSSSAVTDGPSAVAGPFINTYTEADQQHFVYLAANGEIWDAFYCPGCSGDKWRLQKINSGGAAPNAPPAASAPFVNVYSGHNQQHFAYLATNENGRNGEIWDAFYCPDCSGNKWQSQQINCGKKSSCVNKSSSAVTDGPSAVAGPFINTYTEADQQHFVYLAANGEIWDAFYCPGCSGDKWRLQKINSDGAAPNAPPAASAPFVNVYSGHNQQHFAYLATNEEGRNCENDRNGEIWDAFYCPDCSGIKWQLQQIAGQ